MFHSLKFKIPIAFICLALAACSTPMPRESPPLSALGSPFSRYPDVAFDTNNAKASLQKGNSTIEGRICYYYDFMPDRVFWGQNAPVSLYPVTPHLMNWYELRDKQPKADMRISPEAAKMRIDVTSAENGKFAFKEMRPGKYFIQANYYWDQRMTGSRYLGANQYSNSIEHVYQNYDYSAKRGGFLEKFVEITKVGQIIQIKLSNASSYKLAFLCN